MRRKFLILAACTLMGVGGMVLLYWFADRLNHRLNGFIRQFPPHRISIDRGIDLGVNSWYLAGGTEHAFYLANHTDPLTLLMVTPHLKDTQFIRLTIKATAPLHLRGAISTTVDSPMISLMEGSTPMILKAFLPATTLSPDSVETFFLQGRPISPSSYILSVYNAQNRQVTLVRQHQPSLSNPGAQSNPSVKPGPTLSSQQSVFAAEGSLMADAANDRLVYLYDYKNQFLVLDTNLNQISRGRTIDTISIPQIRVVHDLLTHASRFSKPPLLVNKNACIGGNWLLVHSALKANNEDQASFDQYDVLDVYDLRNNQYQFSFYFPPYLGSKLTNLALYGHTLIAIQDHYLVSFHINF